jgi:hypothetical protein
VNVYKQAMPGISKALEMNATFIGGQNPLLWISTDEPSGKIQVLEMNASVL